MDMKDSISASGGAADDMLLSALGYKVQSSHMGDLATNIQHLEHFISHDPTTSTSNSNSSHYNPSNLSTWFASIITDLHPVSSTPIINHSYLNTTSTAVTIQDPNHFSTKPQIQPPSPHQLSNINKTTSTSGSDSSSTTLEEDTHNQHILLPTQDALVSPDVQANGVTLIYTLMACAEAVHQGRIDVAGSLLNRISLLALSQPGAMGKVATYFAQALARRIYTYPQIVDTAISDLLEMHFYDSCPYLKFAHFTANQALLEAFANKKRVHVIDVGIKHGMQWPALMQALAARDGGPPKFRLTGIGPSYEYNTVRLQQVGLKLAQLAETVHLEFEYRCLVVDSLADLTATMMNLQEDEVVAVNSVFQLHQMLARPTGIEEILSVVKEMKPEIITVVEQEANHNQTPFLERFNESLHYYSTLFDSLEESNAGFSPASDQDKLMSEVYLGRQINNVVACEGPDRFERHETLEQWKVRFASSGLQQIHFGSSAFKHVSTLLELFTGGGGFRVEEKDGCLMLGWHTRSLITSSAWKLGQTSLRRRINQDSIMCPLGRVPPMSFTN